MQPEIGALKRRQPGRTLAGVTPLAGPADAGAATPLLSPSR